MCCALRGAKVERIFRETKVLSIGGGASEVMKDLAAKQLGY
jgi:acyl-CoA dehydrogenase